MKKISLNKGMFALVDDNDFERINKHKWRCDSKGYAVRTFINKNGKKATMLMHREILSAFACQEVDHINQDKLDNQKSNLRQASKAENRRNVSRRKDNTSGYKGVSFDVPLNKWKAQISFNNKKIHLGYFMDKEAAAITYDKAAKELHGEFAFLNFNTLNKHGSAKDE